MSTIASISTATGTGGIGIIRISGQESFNILDKIFVPKNNRKQIKGYDIKYGNIIDKKTKKTVDEVLVSYFIAPKSYTKENMCEINSHGSNIILNEILNLCLANGAMLAEPGEFTKRAFLNGRIDLSQAESVIDIINAKSKKEKEAAMNQLEGYLSKEIGNIKQDILEILSDIEASIDYPEYDIEEITNKNATQKLNEIEEKLQKLEDSFVNGRLIKEGIKTAIIGRPNAGKSSLLNSILKEERAIVTDIEGTTRDTIEEFITIKGIPLKIIDTAGIRDTKDEIEKIGVEKSRKIAQKSDLNIAIFDITRELNEEDQEILEMIKDKAAIIVLNKTDIKHENKEIEKELSKNGNAIIKISAVNNEGIEKIYEKIVELFSLNEINVENSTIITNTRHKESIKKGISHMKKAQESIENSMPIDVVAIHIRETLEALGEITGESVTEDIINKIFSKFCLGK